MTCCSAYVQWSVVASTRIRIQQNKIPNALALVGGYGRQGAGGSGKPVYTPLVLLVVLLNSFAFSSAA